MLVILVEHWRSRGGMMAPCGELRERTKRKLSREAEIEREGESGSGVESEVLRIELAKIHNVFLFPPNWGDKVFLSLFLDLDE